MGPECVLVAPLGRVDGLSWVRREHNTDVTVLIVLGLVAWIVLPLPLAVMVGRAFAAGSAIEGTPDSPITADDPVASL
jgi:hypothetical protein